MDNVNFHGNSLVSVDWLKQKIQNKERKTDNLVVLDVSWSSTENMEEKYKSGHIPGARYLNVMNAIHTDLYPRNLPTPEKFQEMAENIGLTKDTHVIVYSDSMASGFFMSARAWWTFKVYGHSSVSVLDGGWQKWIASGGDVETIQTEITKNDKRYVASSTKFMMTTLDAVRQGIEDGTAQIIDSRPATKYKDGHIKGAKNFPMSDIVDTSTGTLKPIPELKKELVSLGIDVQKPVITYCGSGMSASSLAFVAHLCGCPDARVYHGGYTEWQSKAPDSLQK